MSCDPWPLVWPCGTPPADTTDEQQAIAVAVAQDMLWSLTGRRLGTCTVTEWYAPHSHPAIVGAFPYPFYAYAPWSYAEAMRAQRKVEQAMVIRLQSRPVESIGEVKVLGTVLDPAAYRLGRGGRLERIDGEVWPTSCPGAEPPVQVTYTWGIRLVPAVEGDPLPPFAYSAGIAVGEIAVELLAGMCGGACKLPSRLSSLSRQGVSLEFLPPGEFVKAGLTGLPLADSFIRTTNPNRLTMRSRVLSPDGARRA